jgi:hypothetical protein
VGVRSRRPRATHECPTPCEGSSVSLQAISQATFTCPARMIPILASCGAHANDVIAAVALILSKPHGETSAGVAERAERRLAWSTRVSSPSERGAVGRVYEDVKSRILSGEIRLRERLDVDHLARTYRVSGTPVRQALSHLAFERLIIPHPTRGFHVALWSEKGLRDLYEWRSRLACVAAADSECITSATPLNGASTYADRIAFQLQRLNGVLNNSELVRAAINADERLRAARVVEPELFPDCEDEFAVLSAAMNDGAAAQLQTVLHTYHHRRVECAGEIRARALLRALPEEDE